ncbi:bifunctional 4-hydroxy-2-oxoglutarate aldolase/2-dehydro-3-deoxy-phosphogluconate aldolase [Agreia sp. VKM Ac-1783]|uniref:bifunctional 4-hydroxy-2-oxoglutarate aldolase/2-dehydro-3-deoxy-phosphogluconate aldolase n=1 Tax=Agreia sp. VKM Ac-1783 TaxID=1938889 RepID=UPI000A2ACB2B|nr:bifunctional 4-hydroxy-2-oxoglutarate aldolase/2-dehydro-3-deoxy-phosphogluconate aldolase [Agreia sp. VKM Ac-1783]SMQ70800.1 2-dehydro-3-deoxyphosphogluconate aldolase / (4S)-4-hydroxy-2-oxoglutarate aldolase [Agreia sp. VKM Ac-1783]
MTSILDELAAIRVLPVVVIDDPANAVPLAEALVAGGVSCAEVTLRTPRALEAMRLMSSVPGFVVGAGTVLSAQQAEGSVENGARFIVSPGISIPVIRASAALDVACVPGVASSSEVMVARDEGIRTLKLFPAAQLGGAAMISALRGPFADISFVPSGGIGIENAASYAIDGVASVSTSWITPRAEIVRGAFAETTERARRFRQEVAR